MLLFDRLRYDKQNNATIAPQKDIHILILRTFDYVTLNGKSDYIDVITLKSLT